jgi:hypothetical protein
VGSVAFPPPPSLTSLVTQVEVLDESGTQLPSYSGPDAVIPIISNAAFGFSHIDTLAVSESGLLWLDVSFGRDADFPTILVHASRPAL